MIASDSASSAAARIALLHLCDSLFPLGGFGHSDGLEAATASGQVSTVDDLRSWMVACLAETLTRLDGPAVLLAWEAFPASLGEPVRELDAEVYALRPSSAARRASRTMGTRLIRTWTAIRPVHRLQAVVETHLPVTFPVAFGVVAASEGIDRRATLEGYFYGRLAATVSAAMRLMTIGQHQAHGLLTELLCRVPSAIDEVVARGARPSTFAPALDLAAMSQQYVHSRLFRS